MKDFVVAPADNTGRWATNFRRHFRDASDSLGELHALVAALSARRAPGSSPVLAEHEKTSETIRDYRRRDRLSNSVVIFGAMAVEAFLNFYGTVRLGEPIYKKHFERGPFPRKPAALLLVCDHIELQPDDELQKTIARLARRRNGLVHPQAGVLSPLAKSPRFEGDLIPQGADDAYRDCRRFFELFRMTVPASKIHLDDLLAEP